MIAITGGKVVTITNGTLENGTVLLDGGKITAVGTQVQVPADAEVIDAAGKWVLPGLIDAHTHISTLDEPHPRGSEYEVNEMISPVTAYLRGLDGFNPHDTAIPEVRAAGFTTCYTGPGSANVIGGKGFSLKLRNAATVQEMAIPGSEQMKMAFGENPKMVYGTDKKAPMTRMGVAAVLREALYNAKVYSDKLLAAEGNPEKAPAPDFKLDALVPVVRGEMQCRIHCHRADDIVTAVRICREFGLKFSIEHATEGYKIADFLASEQVPCVVGPLTLGPEKMEVWGEILENPALLERAGVQFCLTEDNASGTKYLPMHIGLCMAHGLSEEAALRGVTINPARLLGLEDRIGSLEPGKDADVAIFDGHPFSNFTHCEATIIDGVVYRPERRF